MAGHSSLTTDENQTNIPTETVNSVQTAIGIVEGSQEAEVHIIELNTYLNVKQVEDFSGSIIRRKVTLRNGLLQHFETRRVLKTDQKRSHDRVFAPEKLYHLSL